MAPLISAAEISARVAELGRQIADDHRGRPLTVVGVLSGSVVFLADLIRQIDVPHQIGFVEASSYQGRATTGGELTLAVDRLPTIEGRDVLLVDDIFDTGRTLEGLIAAISARNPARLTTAVLLWKEGRQVVSLRPDYFGFKIPDVFVIGYGLDYDGDYRHLPEVRELDVEGD